MAVIHDGKERALECDTCGDTTDPMPEDEFKQMVKTAKGDGWLIVLQPDGFEHTCPACRMSSRLDAARSKFGR